MTTTTTSKMMMLMLMMNERERERWPLGWVGGRLTANLPISEIFVAIFRFIYVE